MKTSKIIFSLLIAGSAYAAGAARVDAARAGDREAVRSLLTQKVDANAAPGDGATALHWAAYHDDVELTKLLIGAGASLKATTRIGAIAPLFMACTNGSAAMIAELLRAGADANSVKA